MNPVIACALLIMTLFTTLADAQYHQGPRGGCYTITKSGGKRYVDRSMCATSAASPGRTPASPAVKKNYQTSPATNLASSKYHLGPRGGCYTLSPSGNK